MTSLISSTSLRLPGVVAALALSVAALPAFAQLAGGMQEASPASLENSSRQWLDGEMARSGQTAGMPLRMEVSVGPLDSRLHLAACNKVEPYIPANMRLWGKTRVGLRCVDGPVRWNVFMPVQVKAFGPAWVLRGPAVAGATLAMSDAMQAEVDWAEEPASVLGDPAQWVGTTVTRNLNAGQALRQSMVRAAQVFEAGSNVRVVAEGPGFAVTSDGQAVGAGIVGQSVRVRMDGGRFMTGTVVDARTVRVAI
ncbi:flagellar basal body P-ring formation chaperone FlgA [Xylophilus sp. GOD-11R]|uniref:flagellar basal body P-ring formation chaperone FlgA n=1 Tax=Xylophilus sp. GOD-11R TaxID=3089814 RepID=UPI00298C97AA|nr:flagellar basal body P-ring formation chaperone FlgA [Xylophilus sp. GOD-11R]WPB57744.1 flagellar basal body P-ring formation chaperone FlgA [Xylophilus sp. GOD-11R]